ncbi:MAG: type IV pilus secretin PilQ [Gammaproteobacteria bacterium]|nr:type IV pilus secretin PilQ [Gammaproteobacteria bacterium]MCI0591296.1 type IV pilus secretin PilQ [Gammaproteobacteria bacterium]
MSYSVLPGDQVQIKLDLSAPPEQEPLSFSIDNPARIALDFPDTSLNLEIKSQAIGVGLAHSVAAVEAGGRTRVVVNLTQLVPYDLRVEGNSVLVTLAQAAEAIPSGLPAEIEAAGAAPAAMPMVAGRPSIMNIDFRRGTGGEAKVIVTLSDPSIGVNIDQQAGNIVIDFLNASLPEQLDRRLDVIDFATPVKEVDTGPLGNGARMVISTTTDNYDYLSYQSDEILTVEVKPLTEAQKEAIKKEKFGYTGERLSLNFQNIEVRAVLQLIADFTGLNMVASDTVTGNLTLRLKNVPWDQALDIILKSKGLGMRRVGSVIMVAPQEEIAAREKLELEAEKQLQELAPLRTEFIQVNYAKASDIAVLIKAEANNLLSERGNVTIDQRTNTLIVQDVATSLESIREMVVKLDIPVRQVLIESRIVNASEDFAKDIGVRFGLAGRTRDPNTVETFTVAGGTQPGVFQDLDPTGFNTAGLEDLIVDLPVADPAGTLGLVVGKVGTWLLQLELSAAIAEGRTEDIANPKVITANQKEALIETGEEIPYQEATSSGATSVSFKKAVLSLRVTPQITPDDRVLLDLIVNQDTRGAPEVLGVPPIDTKEVNTQVLVDNGETVVLGGVYSQNQETTIDRVPWFSDLPLFGFLFKRTLQSKQRAELLIFVTPKILKETLQAET